METISISKFNDYIRARNPTVIMYSDENNSDYIHHSTEHPNYSPPSPLFMCLTFDEIRALFNPNTIILKGECGTMYFKFVEKINLGISASLLGDTATIYCKIDGITTSYTLVMR